MDDRTLLDHVARLRTLESRLGADTGYSMLQPLSFAGVNTRDPVGIQDAAREVARFLGLSRYVFIVGIAKQGQNIGGHVELSYAGDDVFVEVSSEVVEFPRALLGVLAHEITHKFLHVRGFYSPGREGNREDELLTETASVFLGLGKLVLNGRQCKSVSTTHVPEGVRREERTLKCGYMPLSDLAFVYRAVCAMRRIPMAEYLEGLTPDACLAVQAAAKYVPQRLDGLRDGTDSGRALTTQIRAAILEAQTVLSRAKEALIYIDEACLQPCDGLLQKAHSCMSEAQQRCADAVGDEHPDPAMRYLERLAFETEGKLLMRDVTGWQRTVSRCTRKLSKFTRRMHSLGLAFSRPSSASENSAVCPLCGGEAIPKNDQEPALVRCRACQYVYVNRAGEATAQRGTLLQRFLKGRASGTVGS